MKLYIKITLLLIIVWPKSFFGQTYFNMLYPPEQGTWGGGTMAILPLKSSYYCNRWSVSNSSGQFVQHFTKIDFLGSNYLVKDTLNFADNSLSSQGLISIGDSAIIASVTIQNYNPYTAQSSLVKYDSTGHIVFHNIDTNKYPYIEVKQIIGLLNSDIISIGTINELGLTWKNQKVVLIKSDSLGNQLWKKTYSIGPYAEEGESIALCTDGGFIIGGSELIIDGPDRFYAPIVIKTDSNGNLQWKKKYGSTEFSNWPAYGITQTQDGGYAFCGGVGVNHNSNIDQQLPWVVKLNAFGGVVWADTNSDINITSSINNIRYNDVIESSDGSIVACGQQKIWYENKPTTDKHRWRGVIKKLSANGNPIWVRYFHHPEINDNSGSAHVLYDIDPTPDGGFVAAGYATFTADNVQSTWVIKVDSFGCLVPGCEVVSVPKIEPLIAKLKVYPNPTSEVLTIDITPQGNQQEFVFELYDILGKRVLVKKLHPFENTINVSNLPSGVYTYKIGSTWGQVVVNKF